MLAAKRPLGRSWSLVPRSSEWPRFCGRKQYERVLPLAAVWQMGLRKMRVAHFRATEKA